MVKEGRRRRGRAGFKVFYMYKECRPHEEFKLDVCFFFFPWPQPIPFFFDKSLTSGMKYSYVLY